MKPVPHPQYLFFIGHNTPLSQAEIVSIIPDADFRLISSSMALVDTKEPIDVEDFGCRLGGTIKIASLVATSSPKKLNSDLVALIKEHPTKNFSLHIIGQPRVNSFDLAGEVKAILTQDEHKSRFVASSSQTLSPVIITKQKVAEFIIEPETHKIFKTIWVHSFKDWIIRDRNKPFITPKGGMMPPKLARLMVNLGIADADPTKVTLLDPFCGTGTILMEASLLGAKVVGSDISKEKIEGSKQNLDWLPQEQSCKKVQPAQFHLSDATNVSSVLEGNIDVIVTEPTLGPPSPADSKIANLSKGLQKLYLGALKDWRSFLKPGARVVIALPIFHGNKKTYSTSDFIDGRENLGYNIISRDLVFTRPGAQIERQIVILEKN